MIVFSGRLPGPNALGCSGSRTKQAPRLVSTMPVCSVQMPTPKWENSVLISDTVMRSRSTTVRYTVSPAGWGAGGRRRVRQRHPAPGVDAAGELAREAFVEQRRHARAHEGGIGDVGVAHGI